MDCGIDIGSTNLKVVLVDDGGRVAYTRSVPSPRVHDGIGIATDALALVAVLEGLIIEGWQQAGGGLPLRSIAAAGVGEDGVCVRADLTPAGPALPWFDKRAVAEAEHLRQRHGHLSQRAGNAIAADRTAAKWLWLHHHRRHELGEAACWVALTDFPAAWWSGRSFMSNSLAPRTACYDVYQRQWIDELLTATHAPGLPPLLSAGQIAGGVRKGPLRDSGAASAETVVAAGGHDHPVAATIIRRFDPNGRVHSMGTANLVYGETATLPEPRLDPLLAYSIPPSGHSAMCCLGVLELSVALAAAQSDADHFRSFLSQKRLPGAPPRTLDDLRHPGQDSDAVIRRVLEGASLNARRMLDAMRRAGVADGPIYTTGGWSRSQGFVELRASIFGQPIHAIGDMELTAIGAALFGAEAATGQPTCPLRTEDMRLIEPVSAWTGAYGEILAALIAGT